MLLQDQAELRYSGKGYLSCLYCNSQLNRCNLLFSRAKSIPKSYCMVCSHFRSGLPALTWEALLNELESKLVDGSARREILATGDTPCSTKSQTIDQGIILHETFVRDIPFCTCRREITIFVIYTKLAGSVNTESTCQIQFVFVVEVYSCKF